jgi:cytochrome b subunit of formate dehydrogenase
MPRADTERGWRRGARPRARPWVGNPLLAAALILWVLPSAASAQRKPGATPESDCLACHGQPNLKSEKGRSVFVDPAKHRAGVHADINCTACHTNIKEFPHPAKIRKVECAACHEEQGRDVPKSAHLALGPDACQICHGSAHDAKRASTLTPQLCAQCHASEVKDLVSSVHGTATRNGDAQSPTCQSCHGTLHRILPVDDPKSPVAKKNLPDTCGSCHSNPDFLSKHRIPFAHPVEAYRLSIHGRAVAAGNSAAASCSDCHSSHAILPQQDPRAKINHWKVPETCGNCHAEIKKIYAESIHGQAVASGSRDAPVCTDCHGEHTILAPRESQSLVNAARVSTVTCGRCHGNERLNARYSLPADRVPTFADSYHGLESRAGGQTVANCASCHGVHNIVPSSDPRSTVNPANLPHTCGKCHRGAGTNFSIGTVHVGTRSASEPAVVMWIRWIYWVMIPFAIGFMFLHHFLDFFKKLRRTAPRTDSGEVLPRMNLNFRIAHWLTVVSFPVLVITGFALKFPESWWAGPLLLWESSFAFRGLVHRVAGVVLLLSLGYHVVHLILVRRDRPFLRYMLPDLGDLRGLLGMFAYNLGFAEQRPTFGKFTYVEKIEYLAFMWGTCVMAATGFVLWFNNLALRYFPKWFSDAATALHYYEAILATLAILIWHMYTVVFDPDVYPMDRAWLTGMASADHLRHTRPEYYAELLKQQLAEKQDAEGEQRKKPPAPETPPAGE